MIALLSPAKNLDFETPPNAVVSCSRPRLLAHTKKLVEVLKKKTPSEIGELMNLSEALAIRNATRYQKFAEYHTKKNSRPAVWAFNGDVYRGLKANTFDKEALDFSQKHVRILSGLYGLLRPLDSIQPYRLEMGTKLVFSGYKNLYEYWGRTLFEQLLKDLKGQGDRVIVNLASNEYFKSLPKKDLASRAQLIHVDFQDRQQGAFKTISFYAKKARGLMARYIVEHRLSDPAHLKYFDYEGYQFDQGSSSPHQLTFRREAIV